MSSNKMPIKWHEENLTNMLKSHESKRQEILRLEADTRRLYKDIMSYGTQIKLAKEKGMEGFDRERFNVKKKE